MKLHVSVVSSAIVLVILKEFQVPSTFIYCKPMGLFDYSYILQRLLLNFLLLKAPQIKLCT